MRYPLFRTLAAEPGDATQRIQEAIDGAAAAGGGSVVLAAGRHPAGGLRLASRVDLILADGAVLAALDDYDAFAGNTVSVVAEDSDRAFVLASGIHDAGVFGPGWIDGGSDAWSAGWDEAIGTLVPARFRPRLLVVENSADIVLSGFGLRMAPMWTVHLIGSRRLRVERLDIQNDVRLPNNDGIVVDGCVDVKVADCTIRTADDGVCLKTSRKPDGSHVGPCRDVRVERCRVATRSCAFKVGTETHADIADVLFRDCVAEDANRGLGIFSRDGGAIERIRFENMRVDCRETPVGFWGSGEGLTLSALDRRPEPPAGAIRHVQVDGLSGRVEGAVVLYSGRVGLIEDVVLRAVCLEQSPGTLGTATMLDLRPTAADLHVPAGAEGRANSWVRLADGTIAGLSPYPDGMPGLYARSIGGLRLEAVEFRRPDPLPAGWNARAVVVED